MKCLILASGFGTRLYPLTFNKAKALLEYKGKPLLNHIIDKVPPDIDVLVTSNKKFEGSFRRWQDNLDRRVEICVEDVWTESQAKGAIGSLDFWIGQRNINEDLLLIAGDNYFEFDLSQFINAYNGRNALVAVYDIGDKSKATQFGVVKVAGNTIIEFQEKPKVPPSSLIATACYVLPRRTFSFLARYCSESKRDNLGSFIAYLLEHDDVHAYTFSELWLDIASVMDPNS